MNGLQSFMLEAVSVRVCSSDSLFFGYLIILPMWEKLTLKPPCHRVVESLAECFLGYCHMFAGSVSFSSRQPCSSHSHALWPQFWKLWIIFCLLYFLQHQNRAELLLQGGYGGSRGLEQWVSKGGFCSESKWQKHWSHTWRLAWLVSEERLAERKQRRDCCASCSIHKDLHGGIITSI